MEVAATLEKKAKTLTEAKGLARLKAGIRTVCTREYMYSCSTPRD